MSKVFSQTQLKQDKDIQTWNKLNESIVKIVSLEVTEGENPGCIHFRTSDFEFDVRVKDVVTTSEDAVINGNIVYSGSITVPDLYVDKISGITNPLKIEGLDDIIAGYNYQKKITGNNGDVVFHNGTDIYAKPLLNSNMVCTTKEDLQECMSKAPEYSGQLIYDFVNNRVLYYQNGRWIQNGQNPATELGKGVLSYNNVTGKIFFSGANGVMYLDSNNSIDANKSDSQLIKINGTTTDANGNVKIPIENTNFVFKDATISSSGYMSAADKNKLDGIAAGAEVNQNAFSKINVNGTILEADSKTDTFFVEAGSCIALSGSATGDSFSITNTGVRAISTGTESGTISVNTNGVPANVKVKDLKSAAYTNSSEYLRNSGTTVSNPNTGNFNINNGMDGNILFSNAGSSNGSYRGIGGVMADTDAWMIRGYKSGDNAGNLEIAVADDGNEGIYVRQYLGGAYKYPWANNPEQFGGLPYRELILMAPNTGNANFPANVNVAGKITQNGVAVTLQGHPHKASDITDFTSSVNALAGDMECSESEIKELFAQQSQTEKPTGTYNKPSTGIPKTDLASDVQTSLGLADSAIQTENDPVFSASPAAGITASDIANWNSKPSSTGTYNKPSTGIPKTDLASDVQTKIDNAIQTETDPVFKASAAAGITSADITNWNGKTANTGTITGIKMNNANKGTSGVVDLGTVVTDVSGKANLSGATFTGNITVPAIVIGSGWKLY